MDSDKLEAGIEGACAIDKKCKDIDQFLDEIEDFDLEALPSQTRDNLIATQEKLFSAFQRMTLRAKHDDSSEEYEKMKDEKPHVDNTEDRTLIKMLAEKLDNRKTPSLKKFDENSGELLINFIDKFEDYCRSNLKTRNKSDWIDELENYLDGETLEIFKCYRGVNETYSDLRDKMLQWHVEMRENRVKKAISKFDKAAFQSSDTLFLFSTKLEKLFRQAYPNNDVQKSFILREKYRKAIPRKERKKLKAQAFHMKYRDEPVTWTAIQKFARTRDNFRSSGSSSDSEVEEVNTRNNEIVVNVSEQKSPEVDAIHNNSHKSEVRIEYDHKQKRFYLVDPSGSVDGNDPSVLFTNQPSSQRGSYQGRGGQSRGGHHRQNYYNRGRGSYNNQSYNGRNGGWNQEQSHGASAGSRRGSGRSPENVKRCFNCNKPGHIASECWSKKNESSGYFKKICYVCGEPGHVSTYCDQRKGPKNDYSSGSPNNNQNSRNKKSNY